MLDMIGLVIAISALVFIAVLGITFYTKYNDALGDIQDLQKRDNSLGTKNYRQDVTMEEMDARISKVGASNTIAYDVMSELNESAMQAIANNSNGIMENINQIRSNSQAASNYVKGIANDVYLIRTSNVPIMNTRLDRAEVINQEQDKTLGNMNKTITNMSTSIAGTSNYATNILSTVYGRYAEGIATATATAQRYNIGSSNMSLSNLNNSNLALSIGAVTALNIGPSNLIVPSDLTVQANASFKAGTSSILPAATSASNNLRTQFPDPATGRNYIRGDLEVQGNTTNHGTLTSKGVFTADTASFKAATPSFGFTDQTVTRFNDPSTQKNYIVGDTDMTGSYVIKGKLTIDPSDGYGQIEAPRGGMSSKFLSGLEVAGSTTLEATDVYGPLSMRAGATSTATVNKSRSHFPHPSDNKNYIVGDTELQGSFKTTGYSTFTGGQSTNNPNQLPSELPGLDYRNHIRGDTDLEGTLALHGPMCLHNTPKKTCFGQDTMLRKLQDKVRTIALSDLRAVDPLNTNNQGTNASGYLASVFKITGDYVTLNMLYGNVIPQQQYSTRPFYFSYNGLLYKMWFLADTNNGTVRGSALWTTNDNGQTWQIPNPSQFATSSDPTKPIQFQVQELDL